MTDTCDRILGLRTSNAFASAARDLPQHAERPLSAEHPDQQMVTGRRASAVNEWLRDPSIYDVPSLAVSGTITVHAAHVILLFYEIAPQRRQLAQPMGGGPVGRADTRTLSAARGGNSLIARQ